MVSDCLSGLVRSHFNRLFACPVHIYAYLYRLLLLLQKKKHYIERYEIFSELFFHWFWVGSLLAINLTFVIISIPILKRKKATKKYKKNTIHRDSHHITFFWSDETSLANQSLSQSFANSEPSFSSSSWWWSSSIRIKNVKYNKNNLIKSINLARWQFSLIFICFTYIDVDG